MKTTLRDVAVAVGVSEATVSRALSNTGRVSPTTRQTVVRAALDLNYEFIGVLDRKRHIAPQTLAVIVPGLNNPFIPDILRGVTQAADAGGHLVIVCDSGTEDPRRGWANLTGLRRKNVAGIVIIESSISGEHLAAVTKGIPVVIFDRDYALKRASTIQADQLGGAQIATEHLLSLGHRHIVHLAGPSTQTVAALRVDGYMRAMADAPGGPLEPVVAAAGWTEDDGYVATRALLDIGAQFTALFAASDPCAIGALAALDEAGVLVPQDVSVIGFDDIQLASYTHPRLTTIRQHGVRLGAAAAMILIRQIEYGSMASPIHETVPVELVVRDSTAAPPG